MKHKIYTPEILKQELPDWSYDGKVISMSFEFESFNEAFGWMARVALYCEQKNHHPNWSNVYHRVDVCLSTHSANAVTELDVELAKFMNHIYFIK